MRQPNCGVPALLMADFASELESNVVGQRVHAQPGSGAIPRSRGKPGARLVSASSISKLSQSHESFSRLKTPKSKICCSPSARRPLRLSRSLVRTMHIVSEIPSVSEGRHLYWAGKTSRRLRMVLSPCFLLNAWFARKVSSLGRARRHSDRPGHDVRQVFEDTNNPRRSGFEKEQQRKPNGEHVAS